MGEQKKKEREVGELTWEAAVDSRDFGEPRVKVIEESGKISTEW